MDDFCGFLTGLLATTACFATYPAVRVMLPVRLALLRAHSAGGLACPDHGAQDLFVRARPARRHGTGHGADVCAVKAKPHTLLQPDSRLFREAGIRARYAGLRAGIALLDTAQQSVQFTSARIGMGTDHFLYVHVPAPS
nr:hypothetical protein [Nitrosomonas nitrosa]